MPATPQPWMTTAQVARLMGVSVSTVQRRVATPSDETGSIFSSTPQERCTPTGQVTDLVPGEDRPSPVASQGGKPSGSGAARTPAHHLDQRDAASGDRLGVESPGAGDSAPPACCAGQREPSVDQRDRATAHEGPGVAGPTADRIGDTGDRCAAGRAVSNVSDGSSSILVGWQCWCGRLNEPELTVCLFCGEPRESNHDQHAGVEDHPASMARALGSSPAAPRAGASHDTQGHSAESINASEIGVAISAVGLFVVIVVALVWAEMRLWGWF